MSVATRPMLKIEVAKLSVSSSIGATSNCQSIIYLKLPVTTSYASVVKNCAVTSFPGYGPAYELSTVLRTMMSLVGFWAGTKWVMEVSMYQVGTD